MERNVLLMEGRHEEADGSDSDGSLGRMYLCIDDTTIQ